MNALNILSLLAQLRRLRTKIVNRISYLYQLHLVKKPFFVAHSMWVRDRGDSTLRLAYDLAPTSVVLDIGGYKGDFAAAIFERFRCHIYIFEPIGDFDRECQQRFSTTSKIRCQNYGLSNADMEVFISRDDDASSTIRGSSRPQEKIVLKDVVKSLEHLGVHDVDLLKINIEGGEYAILPHLIETGLVRNIRFLQIQFHDFIPNAVAMRDAIRAQLAKTHKEQWNYPFIWESWERL